MLGLERGHSGTVGVTPVITSVPLTSCRKTEQPVTRPPGAGPDPGDLRLAGHGRRDLLVQRRQLLAELAAAPHRHPEEDPSSSHGGSD